MRDAHSLYLETAPSSASSGSPLLAAFLAGAVGVAARARRTRRAAIAALRAYALHAGLDWDWEMPALTLVAIVLLRGARGDAGAQRAKRKRSSSTTAVTPSRHVIFLPSS